MIINVIRRFLTDLPNEVSGCCVALSGGMDSSVLLHALAASNEDLARPPLRAVHVNHGLHPDASRWALHCQAFCDKLGVPLTSLTEAVPRGGGRGLEAAARAARYAAFAAQLRTSECLLTAHHEDDQLETLLLRLLRGTGVDGLGGIVARRQFADGWLQRPLLMVPKAAIVDYANHNLLGWLADPSNEDVQLDRNYLRCRVVPLLRARWPAVATTAARTARLARDAAAVLDELAAADAAAVLVNDVLELPPFRSLSAIRQRHALRHALKRGGFEMPSDAQLTVGIQQLLSAAADRQPVMRWPGGQVRRYRECLYLLSTDPDRELRDLPTEVEWHATDRPLELGSLRGNLRLERVDDGGFRLPEHPLRVGFRIGGERIRGLGRRHHVSLKKLFQERGVLPWMRGHIPLVYAGERLVSVADLLAAGEFAAGPAEPGYRIVWEGHAPYRERARSN